MYKNISSHWTIRFTIILLLIFTGCSLSRPKKKNVDTNPGYYYIEPFNPDKKKTETVVEEPKTTIPPAEPKIEEVRAVANAELGKASYYGDKFQGRPTASGEPYDRNKLTAAHKTLPFGAMCKVTNIANGKSVMVRVNDRGPFVKGRLIDLSYKAFTMIGGIASGVIEVKVEVIK